MSDLVSTHSHPKVAATSPSLAYQDAMFQHTATRRWLLIHNKKGALICGFQHTATRRWLPQPFTPWRTLTKFQHTATRRWLLLDLPYPLVCRLVSTHSHPKVAAAADWSVRFNYPVSTHSHPKVAASETLQTAAIPHPFQHTATRRWLPKSAKTTR